MNARFTYWREEDGMFLGYLAEFPDHWRLGLDLDDLKTQLLELHESLLMAASNRSPYEPVLCDLTD
jgi:hypothetical protein